MADNAEAAGDFEPEVTPGYKVPKEKKLDEILTQDKEDESLEKYKKQLLGEAALKGFPKPRPNDPRNVIVSKLLIIVEGRPDIELELEGDVAALKEKENAVVLKEGCEYKVRITFFVQNEIVTGLKYNQAVYRKGIRVDKHQHMVGSYGPKETAHEYNTPKESAPQGMLQRGRYNVKSAFTDDYTNKYLEWEWSLKIAKDWDAKPDDDE